MTTIRFGLSATFPGRTQGEQDDANWTPLSTNIAWVNITLPVSDTPGTNVNTHSGSLDIPAYDTPNLDEQTLLSVAFGGASPPPPRSPSTRFWPIRTL